jgi:4-aminobutyrate aminotransferase-like enzyme/GNAT superfamily N-acetyltransferase
VPDGDQRQLQQALRELEQRQRAEAPAPGAPVRRETGRVRIPEGGAVPQSDALLERLYAGELVAREKKPYVVDTRRCHGPMLVSVDANPMVLLDACSQIATLTHGFAHEQMVQGIHEGRFDACLWHNPDVRVTRSPELEEYEDGLLAHAPAGLKHVCFVGAGGAEANEKALRIARLHCPDGDRKHRVLAFRHSFHGRTLVALMSTWNPAKRGPFEFEGYETVFSDTNLDDVKRILDERGDEIYAAIIEPMQAEGGDVHLTMELVRGIRRLTREHGIPLIADEVQTGFGTGGPFFWWHRLGLGYDPETSPDLLTCAKKAQLGVVISRWPDPEPDAVNVVSGLRGLIQLQTAGDQRRLDELLRPRLAELTDRFEEIENPRVAGTTFAFDLPDTAARDAFVAQRFQRGFMVYGAGTRTIRFRLSAGWGERHLDDLFARIAIALEWLDDAEGALEWSPEGGERPIERDYEIREVREEDWPQIMKIEFEVYEPARADTQEYLSGAAATGVGLVAVDRDSHELLGFCMGGKLEAFDYVAGVDRDENLGKDNTFHSADVTVSPRARGRGIGRGLKRRQIEWAAEHGYRFMTGRNRVGHTTEMTSLNRSFGSYLLYRLKGVYSDGGDTDYYRIALQAPAIPDVERDPLDVASGMQAPFGPAPAFMKDREWVGPAVTRLNLSNWTTMDVVHYTEHLRHVLPRGTKHVYFTSSRDELVDKSLRCLRISREKGQIAIGLDGGYVGQTTAAARSLSDPRGFGDRFGLFDWPRLPHPARAGIDATIAALDAFVSEKGSEAILGLYVELVGERSGLVLAGDDAERLAEACRRHDVPLVLVESTTGLYRSGHGAWGVDGLPASVVPDLVLWYPGGQLGHVFVGDRYWVGKPLMLISTWDGDEVSVARTHEHLRRAWQLDLGPAIEALDEVVSEAAESLAGTAGGQGLYRTIEVKDAARIDALLEMASGQGLRLRRGLPNVIVFAPALDVAPEALSGPVAEALRAAIAEVMG